MPQLVSSAGNSHTDGAGRGRLAVRAGLSVGARDPVRADTTV
ncbi:hypothetical protein I546_4370 [Mycobacterium kansasii 732]|nr:hypothetical protein I546_4370 [Mycobacterium kansasii 732]